MKAGSRYTQKQRKERTRASESVCLKQLTTRGGRISVAQQEADCVNGFTGAGHVCWFQGLLPSAGLLWEGLR